MTDESIDIIAEIPGLETIDLSNTPVNQRGIERLRVAKPSLVVRSSP